jgi:alpha-ketoglutarate-dependent taurine dioxygenase
MQMQPPVDHRTTPFLVEPGGKLKRSTVSLCSWAADHRHSLDEWLHRDGAVLLRGFDVGNPEEFHDVVAAIRPRILNYVGGDSPRKAVGDGIYTSTEFPPNMEIGLHNELSYTRSWPERVFFCCLVAADSGGETHLADSRKVFAQMDPAVRHRFSEEGVIYRQHLRDGGDGPGPGKSWQETFETMERAQVERVCASQGMEFQWTHRGLRTSLHNPGVLTHPVTGEICWFNQADMWHARFDTVKAQETRTMGDATADEALGSHACYGDGSEIPMEDLTSVRATCKSSERLFTWQAGDVLILDNVLTMHGRKPFKGQRRVLVAMA